MAWSTQVKEACIVAHTGLGMSVEDVAATYKVPKRTVQHWLRGEFTEDLRAKNGAKVAKETGDFSDLPVHEKLDRLLNKVLDKMMDTIEEAPYNHLATSAGIMFDKIQILTGRPTEITENRHIAVVWNWEEDDVPEFEDADRD